MEFKFVLAMILVSLAAAAAVVTRRAREDEVAVQEEAARQLSALREYLLGR